MRFDLDEERRINSAQDERDRREEYTARVNDVPVEAVRQAQAAVTNYGSLAVPPVTTHPCRAGVRECNTCVDPEKRTCPLWQEE